MNCNTCINALADRSRCPECLGKGQEIRNPDGTTTYHWDYKYYNKGDPISELIRQQRNGERNIVLGGEGEHEVNVNWTIEEATKKLSDTCEAVGGLSWREGDAIIVDTYHGAFHLIYENQRLRRILKAAHALCPLIHWWTSTNDYDEFRKRILAAMSEKELISLEKEVYSSDLDESEKRGLAEYMQARIGQV